MRPKRRLLLLGLLFVLGAAGCGESEQSFEITEVRDLEKAQAEAPEDLTPAQRYGYRMRSGTGGDPHGAGGHGAAGHGGAGHGDQPQFGWKTPEGWEEKSLGTSSMRKGSWGVAGEAQTDCSLTVLQGSGGGLAANVNRWRGEMGLDPMEPNDVMKLPTRELLGRKATYINLTGTFSGGRSGAGPLENARMLGLVLALPQAALFLKFTGPAGVIEAQQGAFEALSDSITFGPFNQKGAGEGDAPKRKPSRGFTWDAPKGWNEQPAKMMRIVTFVMDDDAAAWCNASRLGGPAGGVEMNINRWRGEMGHRDALDAAGIAKLKAIEMLGGKGTLIDVEGDFSGTGGIPQSGARMLGVVCPRENDVVFVKMVGPVATVAKHYDAFVAFCRSLEEAR